MSPAGKESQRSPQPQVNMLNAQPTVTETQVTAETLRYGQIEDFRDHEDFSAQIENDAQSKPRVKLPDRASYVAAAPNRHKEKLEEGEIEDVDQLDGADLGDFDLDYLLELEDTEVDDYNLYDPLRPALPPGFEAKSSASIIPPIPQYNPPPPPSPPHPPATPSLIPSPLFTKELPSAPPKIALPGPIVKRFDVFITSGEYALFKHPQLKKWRVKKPSRLRTCWMSVREGNEGIEAIDNGDDSEESEEFEVSEDGLDGEDEDGDAVMV